MRSFVRFFFTVLLLVVNDVTDRATQPTPLYAIMKCRSPRSSSGRFSQVVYTLDVIQKGSMRPVQSKSEPVATLTSRWVTDGIIYGGCHSGDVTLAAFISNFLTYYPA